MPPEPTPSSPSVIWITGYSCSGKTTVARRVHYALRAQGLNTIHLDGDDLRSIFSGRWGYERDDRTELARVYFRLCSHLVSQGFTVVISAVAMYDEVRQWIQSNLSNCFQVYLNVPREERERRDYQSQKFVYTASKPATQYDEPTNPDLEIQNYGDTTPEEAADTIIEAYYRKSTSTPLRNQLLEHWRSYYTTDGGVLDPSPFARHVASLLTHPVTLLDVGCGNGRDASFFARQGHHVTACDISAEAIDLCLRNYNEPSLSFIQGRLPDLIHKFAERFDVLYSRFCFHAMPESEELATLTAASHLLREGGTLFVECRSINDPLARKGEVLSPNERLHGHYRRFIIPYALSDRVEASGFKVEELVESNGLAQFGDEDPVIIRLIAQRS